MATEQDWVEAMALALDQARLAGTEGDVPVGAVLLDGHGALVGADRNRRQVTGDVTAHAELLVLSAAGRGSGDWRLPGHTLVVTLEPCAMCAMAAVWSRVERIVFGASDPRAGAVWSLYNIPQDARLNHRCDVVGGLMAGEAAALLEAFFAARRADAGSGGGSGSPRIDPGGMAERTKAAVSKTVGPQ